MMGMSSNMYWLSWFVTHWSTAMVTVLLIVLIGIYPFEYTSPVMQLIFYSLWITSVILWNYMISTVFSRSITASVGINSIRAFVHEGHGTFALMSSVRLLFVSRRASSA